MMELREIELSDYIKYTDFVNQLIREGGITTFSEELSAEKERIWLERQLFNQSNVFMIALDGDRIIGAASFLEGDSYDEIADLSLYILADYRNHGVGTNLLELAISRMKEKPHPLKMILDVFEDNVIAYKLYSRLGFVVDDSASRRCCDLDGKNKKLIRMKYDPI